MMQAELEGREINLRPVEDGDLELLFQLYASTRAEEMALVPWTEEQRTAFLNMQFAAQQEHYREKYPTAQHYIISFGGSSVGGLHVARLEDELRIIDLTLLPEHRSKGTGTQLLKQLLCEGAASAKRVRIYVESFNPSMKLFERMGFLPTAEHGIHVLMEWVPGVSD